ncbi:hypothetical protein RO3G_03528 [Rhizopus delemar RA 99-880]|uniref:Uncharacterized protein n=1 Tax=Rhizopus delemar (strain RA 99-880 / ATCC MYA-4621 / FGSC 9543 / NRRL 43880) TaxID=246409 RepID=I1BRJ3_RHIO9|nr:hypothetical protein RO3G_03528 [Rhizopus delemar RA 99-880]|eukprot:EIE78823.1 hypothetical protein RO3G_03528 [Rhizopus delemar RA 99-880]
MSASHQSQFASKSPVLQKRDGFFRARPWE